VHQLDGGRRRVGERGMVVAAGRRHREAQGRADARPARKHRMPHRGRQPGWMTGRFAGGEHRVQRVLDASRHLHAGLHLAPL
jgi:hypothetical protein